MKAIAFFFVTLGLLLSARAQAVGQIYSSDQLDQMLGPIALYPDPLVALILPASTVPDDITLAANYLAITGDPAGIDAQLWDPSVKALAHYPEVITWMNQNIAWTGALGAAFTQQPADVMKSIMQLRAEALAAGTLVNTPQQQIDVEGDTIRIIPTQDDQIYVPSYDPTVVYEPQIDDAGGMISFGPAYPVGGWLTFQCDWDTFAIWTGPWTRGWAYYRNWQRDDPSTKSWQEWHPDPIRSRTVVRNSYQPDRPLPTPGVPRGVPARPGPRPVATSGRLNSAPDYRGRGVVTSTPARPAPPPFETTRNPGVVTPPPARSAPERTEPTRSPQVVTPAPTRTVPAPAPTPASPMFGSYTRGADARDFSDRGQVSRAAPVSPPPSAAPSRSPEPPRSSAPEPSRAPAPAPATGGGGRRNQ